MTDQPGSQTVQIDSKLLHEMLTFSMKELQHARRSRFLSFVLRIAVSVALVGGAYYIGNKKVEADGSAPAEAHIASIAISGEIASGGPSDADKLIPAIRKAMEAGQAKAVLLMLNSPGGSPVQADRFYSEIIKLRKEHPNKKIYAVVEDLCASACYYIASATDSIYVNKSSIVGSIGVITAGFGFTDLMSKVGVERRVMTAGENKALMDPYSPMRPDVREYWTALLAETHQTFIKAVKDGRGARLKSETPGLFSGLVWSGTKSVEFGLADKIASASDVSEEVLKEKKINIIDYTPMPDFMKRLGLSASTFVSQTLAATVKQVAADTSAQTMELK